MQRNFMLVRKQQLEMEHETTDWFKLGKAIRKGCNDILYCHPVYLTSMQSISCEMPG